MFAARVFAILMRPNNPRYLKHHKIQLPANKPFTGLKLGTFGLVAKEAGILTAKQLEAARMAMWRVLKRKAKVWVIPVPNRSYTKKPAETRMGKGDAVWNSMVMLGLGKGPVEGWAAAVAKAGILFEAAGCSRELFWKAARLGNSKLPIDTVPIQRE